MSRYDGSSLVDGKEALLMLVLMVVVWAGVRYQDSLSRCYSKTVQESGSCEQEKEDFRPVSISRST